MRNSKILNILISSTLIQWTVCNKWLQHCQKETLVFVNNTYCSPSTWQIARKLMQVLKTPISGINTSSQTFMPFIGVSFINDCLLQTMLHINHPLLQFADITDPLLNTAALFSTFLVLGFRPGPLKRPYILQAEFWGLTCNRPLKSAAIVIFKFHKVV